MIEVQRIELSSVQGRILNLFHMLVNFSLVNFHLLLPVVTLRTHFAVVYTGLFLSISLHVLLASNH